MKSIKVLGVLVIGLAVGILSLAVASRESWAAPFSAARIIFEVNATAGDAGIQVFLDGEPWKNVKIFRPDGVQIFKVQAMGNLEEFGLTELFSESNEPPFDELSLEEVLEMFPEGKYKFEGTTVEGGMLKSTATLDHDLPCGPVIVSPGVLDPNMAMIEWNDVTNALDPETGECGESTDVDIVAYQVIVEQQNPQTPPLVFSVFIPAGTTEVTVPQEFLAAGTDWKFEVLAIEASGNQTISESTFETN